MTTKLAVAFSLFLWVSPSWADEFIYRQDWAKIRNATAVLQLPALQRVVYEFEHKDNAKILIRYPGGDAGNAWALELRDWLVSLGIGSEHIRLEPGSGLPNAIAISTETGH